MKRPPVPYRLDVDDVVTPAAPAPDVFGTVLAVGLVVLGGLLFGLVLAAWWTL